MFSKEAIEQLQNGIQKPEVVKAGAYEYLVVPNAMTTKKMAPAQPTHLKVSTLDGLVSYLKASDPKNELWPGGEKYLVHIGGHDIVSVISDLDSVHMLRRTFVVAQATGNSFNFGSYHAIDVFIIGVMSNFIESDNRQGLLNFVSQMKAEHIREQVDEGAAQNVTIKTGITTVGPAQVPNPIDLSPYVTFPEVTQPTRSYVFRIHQEKPEDPIKCGLFPVDSTAWICSTVELIRLYFQDQIERHDIPAVVIS